jgi:hypothetical protein
LIIIGFCCCCCLLLLLALGTVAFAVFSVYAVSAVSAVFIQKHHVAKTARETHFWLRSRGVRGSRWPRLGPGHAAGQEGQGRSEGVSSQARAGEGGGGWPSRQDRLTGKAGNHKESGGACQTCCAGTVGDGEAAEDTTQAYRARTGGDG